VTFAPGAATRTVIVPVLGDTAVEGNETFFVNLSNATNANITDNQGLGTITNNDLPTVSINDVTHAEGQSGTTNATFTLTLSAPLTTTASVRVNTANGTATAPGDYTAVSNLTVTFAAGETSKTVDVPIIDDTLIEGAETFTVNLSVPVNATIGDGQGTGTITDTDTAGGFFSVAPCRVIDTRGANGPALAAQSERVFVLTGQCGVPATAKSVVVNLTAIDASESGFLRAYAAAPAPNTTVLSFNASVTRGNNAIVELNPAGEATIFTAMTSGTVHLTVDVMGYFE
jgi:Calx-beta domain-containing protein